MQTANSPETRIHIAIVAVVGTMELASANFVLMLVTKQLQTWWQNWRGCLPHIEVC